MKKILSILLTLAMLLSLAACGGNNNQSDAPDPTPAPQPEEPAVTEKSITDGIFDGSYYVEGHGDQVNFIHFYETDENTGKAMFYFSVAGGNLCTVGYYTVEETPFAYTSFATHEDKANKTNELTGSAPFTVSLTDMSGEALGAFGYDKDEGALYQVDCSGLNSGMLGYNYVQDAASAHSPADENGIVLQKFVSPDDETCFVEIYHNYTYGDYMTIQVLGSWSSDAAGRVYTLTPEDGSAGAVLTVSEDGATATYQADGGEEIALVKPVAELKEQYFAETDKDVGEGNIMHFYMALNLYEDNTAVMLQSYAADDATCAEGAPALTGSWALNEGSVIVVLDGESYPAAEDGSIDVNGIVFSKGAGALMTMTGEVTTSYNITVAVELGLLEENAVSGKIVYSSSEGVLQEVPLTGTYDAMDYNGVAVITGITIAELDATYEVSNSAEGMFIDMPMDLSTMGGTAEDVVTVGISYPA